MITFITSFKPFEGLFDIIQRNALRSWLKFVKNCDIVVVGEERGLSDIASEYGLKVVKEVARSKFGTPLFSHIIKSGERLADHEYICFINSDIILLDDFELAFKKIKQNFEDFLMLSIRTNLDITESLNFDDQQTVELLKAKALEDKNKRQFPTKGAGFDLLVFRKGFIKTIPPFIVGRGNAYIRWMIYYTKVRKKPVIESSPAITAIHQNHDYKHIKDPKILSYVSSGVQTGYLPILGEEYLINSKLLGVASYFSGQDVDYLLTYDGIVEHRTMHHLLRRALKFSLLPPLSKISLPLIKFLVPTKKTRFSVKRMLMKSGLFY